MGYIETNTSWDYVGITIYPLDENGQRITKTVGQDTVEVSYYLRDFGLYRVSNSNRYNDTLTPTIKHTTVEVPGGDGMYWFGSQHTQKQFTVKFAYDSLEEKDLYTLRDLFKGKNRLHIIFDEYPYKYYDVVVSQAAQFDYVPFTEDRTVGNAQGPRRIFKGEGSVQFTSYTPYAIGTIKYWDKTEAPQNTWANWDELQGTTKILTHTAYNIKGVDRWNGGEGNKNYGLWNGGDLPCDFLLSFDTEIIEQVKLIRLFVRATDNTSYEYARFQIGDTAIPASAVTGSLTFDSKLHLVYDEAGHIFNKYLVNETLFTQIPPAHDVSNNNDYFYINSATGNLNAENHMTFVYKYKFY